MRKTPKNKAKAVRRLSDANIHAPSIPAGKERAWFHARRHHAAGMAAHPAIGSAG